MESYNSPKIRKIKSLFYQAIGRPDLAEKYNPRYDGGFDPFGRHFKENIWGKIAIKLEQSGIDNPELFIQYLKNKYEIIYPQNLLSDSLIQKFKNFYAKCLEALKISLGEDKEEFHKVYWFWRQFYDPISALRLSLTDDSSSVSSLFRYVLAKKAGFHEIADKLREGARKRYRLAPSLYKEVFGNLPELEE